MLPMQRSYAALLRSSAARQSAAPLRAAVSLSRRCETLQQQKRQAHAISNPTLANIEKRWEAMPPQEQADLWMALRDRMKVDWNELTLQEKKAAYWIAFGPHGPRAEAPPGENAKVALYTVIGLGVSAVVFGLVHSMSGSPPRTMTKEYQEATNEYMKENNMEPISLFTPDYKGPGMVQSKPGGGH